jgi:DNA-binding LacI/PurR family transcriptional regulator
VTKILSYIEEKGGRPGDRLPSERDFARELDVGRLTVNKALACLITEGHLRREGYKLFVAAGGAKKTRATTIGVLCPHPLRRKQRTSQHNLVEAAHDACAAVGVQFTPVLSMDGSQQHAQLREMLYSEPDGIVMWPHFNQSFDDLLQSPAAQDIPIVVNDAQWEGADFVGVDNFSGIQSVLTHLAGLGHREVAYITHSIHSRNLEERREAYLYGASRRFSKTSCRRVWTLPGDDEEGLPEIFEKNILPDAKLTAICCSHDFVALDIIRLCLKNGIDVPERISVSGFDGIEAGETCLRPLTTANQDFYQIGAIAVDLLLRRIHMKQLNLPYEPAQIRLAPRLVLRDSTARVRAEKPR